MRKGRRTIGILAGIAAALFLSCASREQAPASGEDSTIVYPSRKSGGVEARITLYEKESKKSGELLGAGRVFTTGENERVRARVEIENGSVLGRDPLLFHLVWLDPEGKSIYTKQIDHSLGDPPDLLESAISIPPDKREPGIYTLRVYLFRELIAEKTFEVRRKE
ncbi:MAG: hypothetical protein ABIH26_02785 [Candidatus Eisenbacteria bacterium]